MTNQEVSNLIRTTFNTGSVIVGQWKPVIISNGLADVRLLVMQKKIANKHKAPLYVKQLKYGTLIKGLDKQWFIVTYKLDSGDNLSSFSTQVNVTEDDIQEFNDKFK